jgi:hypothetical protein
VLIPESILSKAGLTATNREPSIEADRLRSSRVRKTLPTSGQPSLARTFGLQLARSTIGAVVIGPRQRLDLRQATWCPPDRVAWCIPGIHLTIAPSAYKGATGPTKPPAWPGIGSTDSSADRLPLSGSQRINIRWKAQSLRFPTPKAQEADSSFWTSAHHRALVFVRLLSQPRLAHIFRK